MSANTAKITKTTTKKATTKKAAISPEKLEAARKLMKVEGIKLECVPNKMMCETIVANAQVVTAGGAMYAQVPIELLDVDPSYQRDRGHYKEIAVEWDPNLCAPLLVSYRDGRFYVVDGFNRAKAAKANGVERVFCLIRTGLTQADEAGLFAKQDVNKTRVSGSELLNAQVVNGEDEAAMAVGRVCDKHGVLYKKVPHKQTGALSAPNDAKRVCAQYGEDMLDDVFTLIEVLDWRMEHGAYGRTVINAGANVLNTCPDRNKAIAKIAKASNGASLGEIMLRAMNANPTISNRVTCLSKLWNIYVNG